MEFQINNSHYKILECEDSKEIYSHIVKEYPNTTDKATDYYYGYTSYITHNIYLNKELNQEEKINTLRHELVHCYLWEHGYRTVKEFSEEQVCDIVSSCSNFIENTIEQYII